MYPDLVWLKYKAIGADVETRGLYLLYEWFGAIRKADLQFSCSVVLTVSVFALSSSVAADNLFAVWTALMLPIEFVWDWLGVRGIKLQSVPQLVGFWILSPLLPALVCALAAISADDSGESTRDRLLLFRRSTALPIVMVLAGIALVNRLLTVGVTVRLYCLFGP